MTKEKSGDVPDEKLPRIDAGRADLLSPLPPPEIATAEQLLPHLEATLKRSRIFDDSDGPILCEIYLRQDKAAIDVAERVFDRMPTADRPHPWPNPQTKPDAEREMSNLIFVLRRRAESGPPAKYAELLQRVETEMKGYEQALGKAVIDSDGKLWIRAFVEQLNAGWPDDFWNNYTALQRSVNKKLAKLGYKLNREKNYAVLKPIPTT